MNHDRRIDALTREAWHAMRNAIGQGASAFMRTHAAHVTDHATRRLLVAAWRKAARKDGEK